MMMMMMIDEYHQQKQQQQKHSFLMYHLLSGHLHSSLILTGSTVMTWSNPLRIFAIPSPRKRREVAAK